MGGTYLRPGTYLRKYGTFNWDGDLKNIRNCSKTANILLMRYLVRELSIVFQRNREFYLFYYNAIFKARVLFKQDVITVKKPMSF